MADADEIARGITPQPGVEYTGIWFNEMGLDRARAAEVLTITGKIRAYASHAFLKRNLNRETEEHRAHEEREIVRYKDLGIPVVEASRLEERRGGKGCGSTGSSRW